jgi:hypothetical protein
MMSAHGPDATVPADRWIRASKIGAIQPVGNMCPFLTVTDAGQNSSSEFEDVLDGADRVLTIQAVLQYGVNWDDVDDVQQWSERVEKLIALVEKQIPSGGYGVMSMRYIQDNPLEVVWQSGKTEAVWEIIFEADYVRG